jgi:CHAT domain-containing protein
LAEVSSVVAAYGRGRVLADGDATAAALLGAFADSDVLHIAAHGRLRTDNPLFSSLELKDGPVTAYDLEQLASLPSTVVLSCCHAGSSHTVAPGESLGLASTLLRLGVRTVVASVTEVDDRASAPLMGILHRSIASGKDAASALAQLQRDRDPTALAFVAYGV